MNRPDCLVPVVIFSSTLLAQVPQANTQKIVDRFLSLIGIYLARPASLIWTTHGFMYSFDLSPFGLRLPDCGCLIQPSGSPTGFLRNCSSACAASTGVSYHQLSKTE